MTARSGMQLDHAPRRRWILPLLLLRRKTSRWYRRAKHEIFEIEGDCLRPHLVTGDVVFVDRTLEPEDDELPVQTPRRRDFCNAGCGAGLTAPGRAAFERRHQVRRMP